MSKTYEIQPIPAFSQRFPQEQSTGQIADVKENAYALAETGAYCDLLRVALAKQVMDNTAILATIEGHYLKTAPSGSNEYRYIVERYTKSAMGQIFGGAW